MKVNLVNEGLKYGLICGLSALLIMFGSWAMGIQMFADVSTWANFVPYMFNIVLAGVFNIRKQNEGFLSFAEGLKFSFVAFTLAAVIVAIGNLLLFNLIDPTLSEKTAQIGLEKTRSMMEKFGAKEEDIEKAMKNAEESMKDTGPKKILLGTGISIIGGFVEALIIAAFAKKEQKFVD